MAASANTVAATLETMIQLQQRLLSMTAAQQQQAASTGLVGATGATGGAGMPGSGGSYRADEFSPSSGMDLQKSLQQLRQSQRYNVGSTAPYSGTPSVGSQPQHVHQVPAPYGTGSTVAPLRDIGSSYQSSTMDAYSSKKGPPYGATAGTYSQAGAAPASSTYGTSTYAGNPSALSASSFTGSSISSALARPNDYRKSSLGPTAPIPTSYGRLPVGQLGRGGPSIKRY